ncbi:vacuolar protein sorting-associated protein 8 homolog [Ostrinia furnacalis]|uniref:vacuolar protein sorting-associated protein 8 homolog n=1 Tax=Ostrinia furnacalis TaxID=93504 RepID=UPI00103B8E0F|nr:vacuolar protein sorting-associated protein 8 homolog [Ostrinia furnacalis]
MDLLKTPSVQSLLDSDLESVESLQYLDIEELDEVEYALPASEAPTLAEVLSAEKEDGKIADAFKTPEEPSACSALQADFMQAVSQQITQAQERSSAGAATALSVGTSGKLTVGTAHGHLLSFFDQTLRWVCNSNSDKGAVSCLCYNKDSTRLLAGYARGLICQYESIRGILLRRVTLGGETWGTLRVTWAGTSGLALDTGGSVWLIKFSRPLGVRSARTSCLFSGARGEVVAMTARDARILALATLSRVIIVAGGRAAGVRLGGPPDTLPVLEWSDTDDRVLVCGRSKTLQWLTVSITGSSISLRPLQRVELKTAPLWLGWLGGNLAIFDTDENLRLWGDDYDKPLDLSHIEPVYASAFFKGLWTDGRVSRAMSTAGVSALGGACVVEGALSLLGRRGIVRVKPRDLLARAKAFIFSGHHLQALRLLCSSQGPEAKSLANEFILFLSERPSLMKNRSVAEQTIKLCLKYNLHEELWSTLWEQCSRENAFVEALGDAAVRGELSENPPSPDSTQALIERLAEFEPMLVERVVASLPLTSLDPHRASVFTREKKLWRGVGAIAAALGGSSGAMRELAPYVEEGCAGRGGAGGCGCAGAALVLAAADALAGRGAAGRPLPDHAQPSARHDALHTLLAEDGPGGRSILRVLVAHEAAAAARLLEQSAREAPFAGPLAKQNRLRVARALLAFAPDLQVHDYTKMKPIPM